MNEILRIENVTKRIKGATLVKDVSFTLNQGDVLGFLGPNGAGKSTVIKMITGLYKITDGEIYVLGKSMRKHKNKVLEHVGAVIENPEMYGYLSGLDNLKLWANMHSDVTIERINEVVSIVKLENRIRDKVRTYSLGMKQRLGIAQALLHRPKLLILDEPTNGLDPVGIKDLRDLVMTLADDEGLAVLVSSHILGEMELMCNKFCIIDNGCIVKVCDKSAFAEGELEEEFMKITIGSKGQIR